MPPGIRFELYSCDGDSCAAVADREVPGLVDQSDAMDLLESVRNIVLNADCFSTAVRKSPRNSK